MLQRLKIVCARLIDWDMILIDEPFSSLDNDGLDIVQKEILSWRGKNKTIAMVLHDKSYAEKFCDRILNFKSGIKIFRTEYSKLINNYKGNFHEAKSIQTGYITDMLQELINLQYLVNPVIINGKWCEIDTLQDLERAKTMFL